MTILDWLNNTSDMFEWADITSARLDAELILAHILKKDRAWVLANLNYPLNPDFLKKVRTTVERRAKREPLAYILGYKEFYGLNFKVTPDVLVPRPETEAMVEYAIKRAPKDAQVLELGTGSGCIAITLAANRPDLTIAATDISPAAIEVAQQNAKTHNVDIKFTESDLLSGKQLATKNYQLILANLPYVPNDTRSMPELGFEPDIALYAGTDGLDLYRRFFAQVSDYLASDGQTLIEASPVQHDKLQKLAAKHGFKLKEMTEYIYQLTPYTS